MTTLNERRRQFEAAGLLRAKAKEAVIRAVSIEPAHLRDSIEPTLNGYRRMLHMFESELRDGPRDAEAKAALENGASDTRRYLAGVDTAWLEAYDKRRGNWA